jgi:hypothetical protein
MVTCLAAAGAALVLAALLLLALFRSKRQGISRTRALLVFGLPLVGVVVLFVLTLDPAPPHTVALAPGGWQHVTPVTVRFVATDVGWGAHSTTYRVDGGAWATGTSARVSGQGKHTVDYYSTDWMGRREAVHAVAVEVDSAAPVTTDDAKPWEPGNVVIALVAKDKVSGVASTHYSLDGGPWLIGDAVHVSGDGRHLIKYRSINRAGNTEAVRTCSFNIDNGAPVVFGPSAVTVGEGGMTALALRVNDVTPKATVLVKIVGETYGPKLEKTNGLVDFQLPFVLPYGNYAYTVEATDLAGNRAIPVTGTLRYPAPFTVAVGVSDSSPPQYATVTAGCRVTDPNGHPISGAAVTFDWHYATVEHLEGPITTDSTGIALDSRPISDATSGYYVEIDVSVTYDGKTLTEKTGFTPQ